MSKSIHGIDWSNVDLTSGYERDQNIIDPLSFDTLLLEIGCNCKDIDHKAIVKQFNDDLTSRIESAKEVFNANLKNIIKQAKTERS